MPQQHDTPPMTVEAIETEPMTLRQYDDSVTILATLIAQWNLARPD
jgi:hypothetical protein